MLFALETNRDGSKAHWNRDARKPVFGASDQNQHESACAAKEEEQKLGISD